MNDKMQKMKRHKPTTSSPHSGRKRKRAAGNAESLVTRSIRTFLQAQTHEKPQSHTEGRSIQAPTSDVEIPVAAVVSQDAPQSATKKCSFKWTTFLQKPPDYCESRYPVPLQLFQRLTNCHDVVQRLLGDFKAQTSVDFLQDEEMEERVLINFYLQFYEQPQIRELYPITVKPCPICIKEKLLRVPQLEAVAAEHIPQTDANATGHTSPKSRKDVTADLHKCDATLQEKSTISPTAAPQTQPQQTIFLHKSRINDEFILQYIMSTLRDPDKVHTILQRFKTELLKLESKKCPRQQHLITERRPSKPQILSVETIVPARADSIYAVAPTTAIEPALVAPLEQAPALVPPPEQAAALVPPPKQARTFQQVALPTQASTSEKVSLPDQTIVSESAAKYNLEQMKEIYFRDVSKQCTLPYLIRFHDGHKRRILATVMTMSLDEFKRYTHVHEAPTAYDDERLLKRCYKFALHEPQVWPPNLFIRLVDLYKFLESRQIVFQTLNLAVISPKLLHWHDLITCTNFDDCVRLDYYRMTGEDMPTELLDTRRKCYYNKCWVHDEWLRMTPTVTDKYMISAHAGQIAAAQEKAKVDNKALPALASNNCGKCRKVVGNANTIETETLGQASASHIDPTNTRAPPTETETVSEVIQIDSSDSQTSQEQSQVVQQELRVCATPKNQEVQVQQTVQQQKLSQKLQQQKFQAKKERAEPQQHAKTPTTPRSVVQWQKPIQEQHKPHETQVPEQQPSPQSSANTPKISKSVKPSSAVTMQNVRIKQEKGIAPLRNLQFDLTNEDEQVRCCQIALDLVVIEDSQTEQDLTFHLLSPTNKASAATVPILTAEESNLVKSTVELAPIPEAQPMEITLQPTQASENPISHKHIVPTVAKAATQRAKRAYRKASNTDFVPQLTHEFRPLPVVTGKRNRAPTPVETAATVTMMPAELPRPASALPHMQRSQTSHTQLTHEYRPLPVVASKRKQISTPSEAAALNAGVTPSPPVAMLPAALPQPATTSPHLPKSQTLPHSSQSFAHALSGDTTLFNNTRLLQIVNQQHQHQQEKQQQQQQVGLHQLEEQLQQLLGIAEVAENADDTELQIKTSPIQLPFGNSIRATSTQQLHSNALNEDQLRLQQRTQAVELQLHSQTLEDVADTDASNAATANEPEQPTLRPRQMLTILYRRLETLNYFSNLSTLNIQEYELQSNGIGQPYLDARIRYSELKTNLYGDFLDALFACCPAALVHDFKCVLYGMKEFHYAMRQPIEHDDLRVRVLSRFLRSTSIFSHCLLDFDCSIRQYSRCNAVTAFGDKTRIRKPLCGGAGLSVAVKASTLERIAQLKKKLCVAEEQAL